MSKQTELVGLARTTNLDEVNAAYSAGALSNRNLIINGAMQVAQRGTSFTANGYGLDRWSVDTYGSGTSKTVTQDSNAPSGFANSLKYVNGGVAESAYYFIQKIERKNFERLSGQTITASFYIKGSQTLNGVPWYITVNGDSTGNDEVHTGTYDITTSWQRVTFTVALGDFSGYTITESGFMEFLPLIAAGSYPNIPANMTINITGVQLEVGDTATPFEHRSYSDQLQSCQRYYSYLGGAAYVGISTGMKFSGNGSVHGIQYPVTMRSAPSVSISNLIVTDRTIYDLDITGLSQITAGISSVYIRTGWVTPWGANGDAVLIAVKNGTNGLISFDAEL